MKKFFVRIINRPTTKGGTQTMFVTGALNVAVILLAAIYRPDLLTIDLLIYLESSVLLITGIGAAQEQKPTAAQGITENPPIKRT